MAEFDPQRGSLVIKLVYYGPALGGKTTNLTRLHDFLRPELRGEMMVLDTRNDRTLFFDLLPLGMITPTGLTVKLKIFTVPGQVAHDSTRKAVLSRADGVVFIADSQRTQASNNAASFDNLAENTMRVGLDFEQLPLVVQFNKRDLPAIETEAEILERWGQTPWPVFFGCALDGRGVVETFSAVLERVHDALDARFALSTEHGLGRAQFTSGIVGGGAA